MQRCASRQPTLRCFATTNASTLAHAVVAAFGAASARAQSISRSLQRIRSSTASPSCCRVWHSTLIPAPLHRVPSPPSLSSLFTTSTCHIHSCFASRRSRESHADPLLTFVAQVHPWSSARPGHLEVDLSLIVRLTVWMSSQKATARSLVASHAHTLVFVVREIHDPRFTRFTIHDSRFTIHDRQFMIHDSRLTIHDSRLTIHDS